MAIGRTNVATNVRLKPITLLPNSSMSGTATYNNYSALTNLNPNIQIYFISQNTGGGNYYLTADNGNLKAYVNNPSTTTGEVQYEVVPVNTASRYLLDVTMTYTQSGGSRIQIGETMYSATSGTINTTFVFQNSIMLYFGCWQSAVAGVCNATVTKMVLTALPE